MALISVDPRGTYLNAAPSDAVNAPTTVLLATLGLVPGDVITLTRKGAYQAGVGISSSGFPFTDASTSLLAVFSGAAGLIRPETSLSSTSPLQGVPPNLPTDVFEDFTVVSGVTTMTIPAGAISLKFSPNDSFFQDNTDPNGDYAVEVRKLDGSTSFAGNDFLNGTAGADSLLGGAGNDILWGGAGNDTLRGQDGRDSLYGGAGDDVLDGGLQFAATLGLNLNFTSYFYATAGVRIDLSGITGDGNSGSGTATGDASVGTDTLISISLIQGSNFNDTITGSSTVISEQIDGGPGDDILDGGVIPDTLNFYHYRTLTYRNTAGAGINLDLRAGTVVAAAGSNSGNDTISNFASVGGSLFDDTLLGSDRTDIAEYFQGRAGNDSIDGRGGFDWVQFTDATGSVTANLVTGTGSGPNVGNDVFSNIEGVIGSFYNDSITGGNAANGTVVGLGDGLYEQFRGEGGNDTIDGGQGYDIMYYANATAGVVVKLNDTLDGAATDDGEGGVDVLRSIEGVRGSFFNDSLTGSDTAPFESFEGLNGDDTIDGLGGRDRVEYVYSRAGVNVNLVTGTASDGHGTTDTLRNIEDVRGSRDFNDTITGSAANNKIDGLGGNDFLTGDDGDDSLDGGDGNDSLDGGIGNDSLSGGLGFDSLVGGNGDDTLRGGDQADTLLGGSGNDYLSGGKGLDSLAGGNGNDTLLGLLGADTLFGDAGFDFLDGGDGDDVLNGGMNGDTLLGGLGNDYMGGGNGLDSLDGGDGNDTLIGGLGTDTLTGGAGNDHFQFLRALDGVINIDLITDYASGQDVIELSAAIFTAYAGQIGSFVTPSANLTYDSTTGVLAYDADGVGPGAALAFAILGIGIHPVLLGNDFLIVP